MRETRLSGSEGGAGPVTRPHPYPYHRRCSTTEARAAKGFGSAVGVAAAEAADQYGTTSWMMWLRL